MIKQIRSIWRLVYGLVTCGVLAAFSARLGVEWDGFGQVLKQKGLGSFRVYNSVGKGENDPRSWWRRMTPLFERGSSRVCRELRIGLASSGPFSQGLRVLESRQMSCQLLEMQR